VPASAIKPDRLRLRHQDILDLMRVLFSAALTDSAGGGGESHRLRDPTKIICRQDRGRSKPCGTLFCQDHARRQAGRPGAREILHTRDSSLYMRATSTFSPYSNSSKPTIVHGFAHTPWHGRQAKPPQEVARDCGGFFEKTIEEPRAVLLQDDQEKSASLRK